MNEFNIDAERTLIDKASYLALYLAFYPDEILQTALKNDGDESMNEIAHIPDDVRDNAELMNLLLTSARRIEHMQLPRFHALKIVLTDILKGFVCLFCFLCLCNIMCLNQDSLVKRLDWAYETSLRKHQYTNYTIQYIEPN